MNDKHKLWCEKYRPKTLNQYVFHDQSHRTAFERMVAEHTIPHLMLSGIQGSGKTTIGQVLCNELDLDDMDVLIINASDENSVDVMRDKIKSFISTYAMSDFKIVQLEEADYISPNGQAILRRMMEEYHDVARFILTCNYEHKIIPAIRSRCQHFRFKSHDKDDVTEHIAQILLKEDVHFSIDLLDKYVTAGYPDIRKIINLVQQNTNDSTLQPLDVVSSEGADYKFQLLELLDNNDWGQARKLVCAEVSNEEWEDLYRFIYQNLDRCTKFQQQDKWEQAITIVADHLYKHTLCADPEINGAAMFIRLGQI